MPRDYFAIYVTIIQSDASQLGWRAVYGPRKTGGAELLTNLSYLRHLLH